MRVLQWCDFFAQFFSPPNRFPAFLRFFSGRKIQIDNGIEETQVNPACRSIDGAKIILSLTRLLFAVFMIIFSYFFICTALITLSASLLQRQRKTLRADKLHGQPEQALFSSGLGLVAVKIDKMSPTNFSLTEPKTALRNGERPSNTSTSSHSGRPSGPWRLRHSRKVFSLAKIAMEIFSKGRGWLENRLKLKEEKTRLLTFVSP